MNYVTYTLRRDRNTFFVFSKWFHIECCTNVGGLIIELQVLMHRSKLRCSELSHCGYTLSQNIEIRWKYAFSWLHTSEWGILVNFTKNVLGNQGKVPVSVSGFSHMPTKPGWVQCASFSPRILMRILTKSPLMSCKCAGWNYLSIPELQRLHRWSLGKDK